MDNSGKTIQESGMVWDDRDQRYKPAYETALRRLETVRFVEERRFDSADEEHTSDKFECAAFRDFLLYMDIDVTGTPTNITISVEFSPEGDRWFTLTDGPFGSLIYVSAQGDKKECIHEKTFAHWMRVKVVSAGCDVNNTFLVSITADISG